MSNIEEFLTDKGQSIKRLIPLVAFIVLIITLIISYLPGIIIADNNLKVINQIIDVFGWVILGGFGFTALEKFSKHGSKSTSTTEKTEEEGNLNQ